MPAEHVEDADGWWLRYAPRGAWWVGTVLPHRDAGPGELERRVAGAEKLYAGRGRGAASSVLATLTRWAAGHQTDHMYLQVERGNAPALRLYGQAGFTEVCVYHYRAG
jgi:GNAT superfamily N-acetyltransferase